MQNTTKYKVIYDEKKNRKICEEYQMHLITCRHLTFNKC